MNIAVSVLSEICLLIIYFINFGNLALPVLLNPLMIIMPVIYIVKSINNKGFCSIGIMSSISIVNINNFFVLIGLGGLSVFSSFASVLLNKPFMQILKAKIEVPYIVILVLFFLAILV